MRQDTLNISTKRLGRILYCGSWKRQILHLYFFFSIDSSLIRSQATGFLICKEWRTISCRFNRAWFRRSYCNETTGDYFKLLEVFTTWSDSDRKRNPPCTAIFVHASPWSKGSRAFFKGSNYRSSIEHGNIRRLFLCRRCLSLSSFWAREDRNAPYRLLVRSFRHSFAIWIV